MPTREIISVQIGNYSNHIGAHWFNLQERGLTEEESEFDPVVLWREGRTQLGKSIWNPRLLVFDLSGNWAIPRFSPSGASGGGGGGSGINNKEGSLEKIQKDALWDGTVERIEQNSGGNTSKSAPDESPDPEKGWGEFTRWKLHRPEENGYSISSFSHNPATNVLSNYGQGLQIYAGLQDQTSDSLRHFAEDCDYLQGFHFTVDQNDGFGGLAGGILSNISDDYEKKIVLCFGTSPPSINAGDESSGDFKMRVANTALAWNAFNHHSSFFTSIGLSQDLFKPSPIPASIPFTRYKGDSYYESSSILAAALDTLTFPYTTRNASFDLHELSSLLNAFGHKMGTISSGFPFPLDPYPNNTLFDTLRSQGTTPLYSLTPGLVSDPEKSIGNFYSIRGFSSLERVIKKGDIGPGRAAGISNAESCLQVYSQEVCPQSVNVVKSIGTPFKLSHPFPLLFDQQFLESHATARSSTGAGDQRRSEVWELSTMASAHNSLQVGGLLGRMIDLTEKDWKRMGNYFAATELEVDDYSECINDLKVLRDSYKMEGFHQ